MTKKRIAIALASVVAVLGAFTLSAQFQETEITLYAELVDIDGEPMPGCNDAPVGVTIDCQVLIVDALVPEGTSVEQIIENPTRYLRAKATTSDLADDGIIFGIPRLDRDHSDQQVIRDLNPGEQLTASMFGDR